MLGHEALVEAEGGEVSQEGTHRFLGVADTPTGRPASGLALRERLSVAIVTSPGKTQPVRT